MKQTTPPPILAEGCAVCRVGKAGRGEQIEYAEDQMFPDDYPIFLPGMKTQICETPILTVTNFSSPLPAEQSNLVFLTVRDPYIFDVLRMGHGRGVRTDQSLRGGTS